MTIALFAAAELPIIIATSTFYPSLAIPMHFRWKSGKSFREGHVVLDTVSINIFFTHFPVFKINMLKHVA